MTMIEVALSADGEQILALARRIAGFNALDQECIEELWCAYLTQGPKAGGYDFLVARLGEFAEAEYTDERDRRPVGAMVGFACYGPTPLTVGVYDLYWLAVDPDARRQGVGRALMARLEKDVRRNGGRMVLIETVSGDEYQAARRFYESCDYRYQAVIHDFYDVGEDLLIFGKRLGAE